MTTTTTPSNLNSGLNAIIKRWDRRLRVQQTIAWFARALIQIGRASCRERV